MDYAALKKMWVLTWSQQQSVFHIDTVEDMLHSNWETYFQRANHDSDWIVVGFEDSLEGIRALRSRLIEKFDQGDPGEFHLPPL
jgi:hypothetical protein